MSKQKKEPDVLAGTDGSGGMENIPSFLHSTKKDEKTQGFLDLVEEDPVEPDNPKEVRGKYWCFVLYPDSAPENWAEILNRSGLAWAVSPLHDGDMNADGTKKKPHYHVIIIWLASTTYNAVKQFTQGKLNATIPQVLHSPCGYYRYFTHKDNPEKFQYDDCEIITGNGFDVSDYVKLTKQQKLELHAKLTQLLQDNHIWSYSEACTVAMSLGWDEYECLTTHTIHFTALCKAIKYEAVGGKENNR